MRFGSGSHRVLWVGLTVVVVGLVLATSWYLLTQSSSPSPCVPPAPPGLAGQPYFVLAACGSTATLGPHSFLSYQVPRLSDGETVVGNCSATPLSGSTVWIYVLNNTEFSSLPPAPLGPPPQFLWSASAGAVGNVSVQVPGSPAQFYVVLENTGGASFSVRWIEALVMYYVTH